MENYDEYLIKFVECFDKFVPVKPPKRGPILNNKNRAKATELFKSQLPKGYREILNKIVENEFKQSVADWSDARLIAAMEIDAYEIFSHKYYERHRICY